MVYQRHGRRMRRRRRRRRRKKGTAASFSGHGSHATGGAADGLHASPTVVTGGATTVPRANADSRIWNPRSSH
jgi:hypothetical protein